MGGERVDGLSELGRVAVALAEMGFAVFPLKPKDKVPDTRHGCKDATTDPAQVERWWRERPDRNIGIACGSASGGLLAIDFDDHPERGVVGTERLGEWERGHGALPETCSQVTGSGGYHLLYRVPEGAKAPTYANQALGVDARGEGAYIVAPPSVHPCGRRYEWETPPEELMPQPADANVMAFVEAHRDRPSAARADAPRYEAPAVISEGGRNDELARLCGHLWAKGVDRDMVRGALQEANRARCVPPLSEEEVDRIWESITSKPKGRSPEWEAAHRRDVPKPAPAPSARDARPAPGDTDIYERLPIVTDKGKIIHNNFARVLIESDRACRVGTQDGVPTIWTGRRYELGWDGIDRVITRRCDSAKKAEKGEVRDYVRLMAPVVDVAPPNLIAFKNGVLDINDGSFMPMSPEFVIPNVIPHDYDPDAQCAAVDDLLWRVSCGDATTFQNLCEFMGVCMYRSNDFSQAAVLLGSGSNGKSTYLRMVKNALGRENYSTLDLEVFGKNFQAGYLADKLANIGDDISNEFLKGDTLAVFKKVVSGEDVFTDVKNSQGFHFRPYCTVAFSANEFPKVGDSTDGVMRRLFPLPFMAKFSRDDAGYDPHVSAKVTTPEAARAFIAHGLRGLAAVVENGCFTPNSAAAEMVEAIKTENDTVAQWLEDRCLEASYFERKPTGSAYEEYRDWCQKAGGMPISRPKFTKRVDSALGMEVAVVKESGTGRNVRVFRSVA